VNDAIEAYFPPQHCTRNGLASVKAGEWVIH
jgi:hypothetical protein